MARPAETSPHANPRNTSSLDLRNTTALMAKLIVLYRRKSRRKVRWEIRVRLRLKRPNARLTSLLMRPRIRAPRKRFTAQLTFLLERTPSLKFRNRPPMTCRALTAWLLRPWKILTSRNPPMDLSRSLRTRVYVLRSARRVTLLNRRVIVRQTRRRLSWVTWEAWRLMVLRVRKVLTLTRLTLKARRVLHRNVSLLFRVAILWSRKRTARLTIVRSRLRAFPRMRNRIAIRNRSWLTLLTRSALRYRFLTTLTSTFRRRSRARLISRRPAR